MATLQDRCQIEELIGFAADDASRCGDPAVDCPNCGQPNTCRHHLEQASDGKPVCFECEEEYERMLAAMRTKKTPQSEPNVKRRIA